MRITQEKLAEEVDVTFQQIQKYEKGDNRVSASTLYGIALALKSSVAYFYEGLADPSQGLSGVAETPAPFVHSFVSSPEGLELAEHFSKIRKPKVRRLVIDMVKSLGEQDER